MTILAINDPVSTRGHSGSSTGSGLIASACRRNYEVNVIGPKYTPGWRVGNLARMASWDCWSMSRRAQRVEASAVINVANTGIGLGIPVINVLHDTMVLDHPGLFDRGYRLYAKMAFGVSVRSAEINVVPSVHSRNQAAKYWPDARYEVIPWCVPRDRVLAPKLASADNYILCVASGDRHKRLPLVIEAVAEARRASGADLALILVCKGGNSFPQVESAVINANSAASMPFVELLSDRLTATQIDQLYDNCFCVISGSIDEGFCLPLLEGATKGVPVVHTSRGAMEEVVPLGGPGDTTIIGENDERHDFEVLVSRLLRLLDTAVWADEARRAWKASEEFSRLGFERRWESLLSRVVR